ncbi:MAG: FAD-binding protein [Myxococcales bacterium]
MNIRRRQLLALSGTGLLGCGHTSFLACPVPPPPGVWNNVVNSLPQQMPDIMAYPGSTAAVVQLVRAAEARGQRVRMTGTGHSFSDVALTDGMLLLPNRLSAMLSLDRARLRPAFAADRHLVRVQGGITIRELNEHLDSKCLALANMGGYDAQTITGVAMTATHGSGLNYGPIASQIASLQLVTTSGEVRQIEPANGITDPANFPGFLEEDGKLPVKLVQDDEEFDAVSVSMGSMGIVTAVVLKTVDKFWLREKRTLHLWSEMSKPGGYLDTLVHRPGASGYPDHVEIYINPYENRAGDHHCVLTQRYRLQSLPKPTLDSANRGILGEGGLFDDARLRKLSEGALAKLLDGSNARGLANILDDMLKSQLDQNYTAESYKVFNLGSINQLRAHGIEMAFPLEQTIPATNALFQQAKVEFAAGRHHSVPFSLRFVKAADSFLAMQHGRNTMMLEMGALVQARGSRTLLQNYEQFFIDRFAARPHWGLDMSVLKSWSQVEALYGAQPAQAWRRVYERLNSKGTFNGKLTDRLGISVVNGA